MLEKFGITSNPTAWIAATARFVQSSTSSLYLELSLVVGGWTEEQGAGKKREQGRKGGEGQLEEIT
jgi:hypothetical protein